MDSEKTGIYYNKIKKYGNSLNPYYVFENGISDILLESEIWKKLTNRNLFSGKLEDLDEFTRKDNKKLNN